MTIATDASLLDLPGVESEYRTANGVRLHVVTAGEEDAPLVVLLHGFPEFWYGWHRVIGSLVDAGYRVVVPDQRGYNLSEKPRGVENYRLPDLSGDVAALIDSFDRESAHVVGHDWGAAVAWDLALRHPERVDRLGICNVPHPTVFEKTLKGSPRQLARSWYVFFFQLPRLPEFVQRRSGDKLLASGFESAVPGTFSATDLARYRAAWRQDGATTAMINWYRAIVRFRDQPPREQVDAPTLVIWGEQDPYLLAEMAEESLDYCSDGRLERFPDATHWVQHEEPARVAELLVEHFGDDAA